MTVVTLLNIFPPARYDAVPTPWVAWHLEEGAVQAGPYAAIDTALLSPVDVDPRFPASRDVTSDNATADALWYRVRFRDGNNSYSNYSQPIFNGLPLELPDVRQVAAHIRSRTYSQATQQYKGTFTHETRPSNDDAAEAIELARDDVLADVGALPVGMQTEAFAAVRSLIALRAAMIIERSFYPDQVGSNKSPYPALRDDYDARLPRVIEAVGEATTIPPGQIEPGDALDVGADGGGAAVERDYVVGAGSRVLTNAGLWLGHGEPAEGFPDDAGGMIGYETKF